MKVIDLLLDIANGKEVPAKIKVYNDIYEFDTFNKLYWNNKHKSLLEFYNGYILTYKVEIIEDTPKEIEKLDFSDWWEITSSEDCKPEMLAKIFNKNAKAFSSKINEIIDKIKREENE